MKNRKGREGDELISHITKQITNKFKEFCPKCGVRLFLFRGKFRCPSCDFRKDENIIEEKKEAD